MAIVDDVAGVTRDRMNHLVQDADSERYFDLVDTGGIGINDVDDLSHEIEDQIAHAIDQADLILFVVDVRDGITQLDEFVAKRLRSSQKPTILVVNKSDNDKVQKEANEFFRLGYGDFVCVSAHERRGKSTLFEKIFEAVPCETVPDEKEVRAPEMKIAIVGRRNVGKSTFVNSLVETERMIVSEVAGTTRDSVDVRFTLDGQSFVAIDTPGLRKKKSIRKDIEFYGLHRAQRSIRHADVTLLFFDASTEISNVDRQLCNYIAEQNKPVIFVVNKWDLLSEEIVTQEWAEYLRENFPTLAFVPIAFITGQTGKNVKKLINHAQMVYKQSRTRVSTGELNRLVRRAVEHHAPPIHNRRRPKIFYLTQVSTQPPTIAIMCNDPDAFPRSYRKYVLGVMRDQLSFGEVPIRLHWQSRKRNDARDEFSMDSVKRRQSDRASYKKS